MTDFAATLNGIKYHFRECIFCFGRGSVKTAPGRYGLKKCANCDGRGYMRTSNNEPRAAVLK